MESFKTEVEMANQQKRNQVTDFDKEMLDGGNRRNYDDREYDNTAGSAAAIGIIQHTNSGKSPNTVIQGSTENLNLRGEIDEEPN